MKIAFMPLLLAALPLSAAAQSLCSPGEQVVFACATRQAKLISMCQNPSGLSYRFGLPQKIELEQRDPGPTQPGAFRYYHYFRAGVDRTSVEFETADARYEVFDEFERPQPRSAGVRVTVKKGERQVSLVCAGKPEAHWYRLEGKIACSDQALNACSAPTR